MRKIIIVLALFIEMAFQLINAQVASYSFSQFSGNYGAINSGTLIGTINQDDDINMVNLPFPFTFNGTSYTSVYVSSNGFITFDNTVQSTEYSPLSSTASSKVISGFGQDLFMGSVTYGEITQGSNTITNVASTLNIQVGDVISDWGSNFGGTNPTVTAVGGNTIILNINSTITNNFYDVLVLNGSLKMNVTGIAPSRVCEFIYSNFSRYSNIGESISFKIRLYETTGNFLNIDLVV